MKPLEEITMTWNEKTGIANFDFADVVGYTQEEVRKEVFRRFRAEIEKSTDQKMKYRNLKRRKLSSPRKSSPNENFQSPGKLSATPEVSYRPRKSIERPVIDK